MTDTPQTIGHTMPAAEPKWYTTKNFAGGVSHLYTERSFGSITTLCGMSNEAGMVSQTAKHCASCTSRLKAFYEAALVEHDWIKETVTVTVVRPVTQHQDDTVENKVRQAVQRKKSWDVQSIKAEVVPFVPVTVDTTQPAEPYILAKGIMDEHAQTILRTEDHVHDDSGRCLKDRSGYCRVNMGSALAAKLGAADE